MGSDQPVPRDREVPGERGADRRPARAAARRRGAGVLRLRAVRWRSTSTPTRLVERARAETGPGRLRRRHAARSPGRAGRRGRGGPRAVGARPVHRAATAARAACRPASGSRTSCAAIPRRSRSSSNRRSSWSGLPRSGTTHLVNLLAADSRFRSMPWWEVAEPTPVRGDGPGRDGIDPRYLRCHADVGADQADGPAHRAHARPAAVEHRGGLRAGRPGPVLVHAGMARPGARRGATTTSGSTSAGTTPSCARSCRCSATCADRTGGCSRRPSTSSSSARCSTRSPTRPSRSPCATRSRCSSRRSRCSPTATGCGASASTRTSSPRTGSTGSNGCCGRPCATRT